MQNGEREGARAAPRMTRAAAAAAAAAGTTASAVPPPHKQKQKQPSPRSEKPKQQAEQLEAEQQQPQSQQAAAEQQQGAAAPPPRERSLSPSPFQQPQAPTPEWGFQHLLLVAEQALAVAQQRRRQCEQVLTQLSNMAKEVAMQLTVLQTAQAHADARAATGLSPAAAATQRPPAMQQRSRSRGQPSSGRRGQAARSGAAAGRARPAARGGTPAGADSLEHHSAATCTLPGCRLCAYEAQVQRNLDAAVLAVATASFLPPYSDAAAAPSPEPRVGQRRRRQDGEPAAASPADPSVSNIPTASTGGSGRGQLSAGQPAAASVVSPAALLLSESHPRLDTQVCAAICEALPAAPEGQQAVAAWCEKAGCSTAAEVATALDSSQQVWNMALAATQDAGVRLLQWAAVLQACKRAAGMPTFLRRLLGGLSGGAAPTRTMSTASGSMEERLHACLFPGQRYSPAQAALLAGRLREVADSLSSTAEREPDEPASKKRKKEQRGRGKELDFSAYQQRYVALELLYLGHEYGGFARQETTDETIEGHLFAALRRTRLVPAEASWQELRYSRGGRTDKGVSALGQVVALLLRSAGRPGQPAPAAEAELDYPSLLNRVLPRDIRVLGWADVPEDFSARFSAEFREYKYLIAHTPRLAPPAGSGEEPRQSQQAQQEGVQPAQDVQQAAPAGRGALEGSLDVEAMRRAAAFFVGEHDFRNFCKVDVAQVQNFRRTILDFRLEPLPGCAWGGRALLQLYIRGTAFLWHQVRCMAAVLLMVGRGEEQPDIVRTLLDLERCPRKPQYPMASEEPLLLYSCTYSGLQFRRGAANYGLVRGQLEDMLNSHLVRAGLLHTIQQRLAADGLAPAAAGAGCGKRQGGSGVPGTGQRHVPLLLRAKEPAVEERLLKLAAAREAGGPVAAAAAADGGEGDGTGEQAPSKATEAAVC